MLKTFAIIFGVVLLAVGIMGFIPFFTPNDHLLGIFHVNVVHNIIHVATGIVGILCGTCCAHSARLFFRVFGIIYGIVALLGLYYVERPILNLIANNWADTILHFLIAGVSLYLGFGYKEEVGTPSDREI